jgi:hypothetical protein
VLASVLPCVQLFRSTLPNSHSFAAVLLYIHSIVYISGYLSSIFFSNQKINSKHAFLIHHPFPLPPRLVVSSPMLKKKAATSVLTASTYNAIQISSGTAGTAEVKLTHRDCRKMLSLSLLDRSERSLRQYRHEQPRRCLGSRS